MMKQKRGSYVINVEFVKKTQGVKGEAKLDETGRDVITVDSGAEESVCPLGCVEDFGLNPRSWAEGVMPNYGSQTEQFSAMDF